MGHESVRKIELGCGSHKREGFFGIDILEDPAVDLVLDVEKEPLPFADNSIDHVYSSHAFEHMTEHPSVLREIFRVCRPSATVEIWTPYGKSNDGMLFGHHTFFTETSFKHICFEYDRFFLGDSPGYLNWTATHYVLFPGIQKQLEAMSIPMSFALDHMFNIALEWGVFMTVEKGPACAPGPQLPNLVYSENGRPPADATPLQPETMPRTGRVAERARPHHRWSWLHRFSPR